MKIIQKPHESARYTIDQLKQYVSGTMSTESTQVLEKDIQTDESLKSVVEGLRHAYESNHQKFDELDEFLEKSWNKQKYLINQKANPKRQTPIYMIAASAVLVIGFFFLFQSKSGSEYEELLALHSSDMYPVRSIPVRGGQKEVALWKQSYQSEDYEKVSTILEPMVDKTEEELFYLGIIRLSQGDFKSAQANLAQVVSKGSANGYQQNARWYLALTYLQSKNETEGIQLLQDMTQDSRHFKQKEAQQLLEKMN